MFAGRPLAYRPAAGWLPRKRAAVVLMLLLALEAFASRSGPRPAGGIESSGWAQNQTAWAASGGNGGGPGAPAPYSAKAIRAPRPQARGHWGERMAAVPDIDRDDTGDLIVGTPFRGPGAVYALSGRSLAGGEAGVLFALDPPEPLPRFGFAVSSLGDADGDEVADIAVGEGKVWIFSGKSGSLIRTLEDPQPQAAGRFGSRIGRAGDLTADGVSEVLVGAPGKDFPPGCSMAPAGSLACRAEEGQALIFDGTSGALLRTLQLPAEDRPPGICSSACGSFGLSVQGPGDADGDAVTDQLVSAPSLEDKGRIYLFSGATGNLLRRIDPPQPQNGASFGFQDVSPLAPGDVNGDGRADIYGNGFLQDGPAGKGQGRAWVFSGADGSLLRTMDDPSPTQGGQFGWSMTSTQLDGDSIPDLYIGSAPHHLPQRLQNGGTYIFAGKDGRNLRSLEIPARFGQEPVGANLGPNLGWSVAAPGDLNLDGRPDYLAGAPYTDAGRNADEGMVFAFLSGQQQQAGTRADRARSFPANSGLALAAVLASAGIFFFLFRRRRRRAVR